MTDHAQGAHEFKVKFGDLTVFVCPPVRNHVCDSNGPEVKLPNGASASCSVCGSLAIDDMKEQP